MSNNPNVPAIFPHAKVPPQKAKVHVTHPFNNEKSHQELLEYVISRLELGREQRDKLKVRYKRIDRQYSAWMKLSPEDQKRKNKQDDTGRPLATQINIPLMYVHLEDMLTYFMSVFAPTKGMYHVVTDGEKQDAANTLVKLMNIHNVHAVHYRGVIQACAACLRYNLGGVLTSWDKERGSKLTRDPQSGKLESDSDALLWEGNRLECLDPYNTFMDPRVHPLKMHSDGEFCATATTLSFFKMQTRAASGIYFNTERLQAESNNIAEIGKFHYYIDAAREIGLDLEGHDSDGGGTDWLEFMGHGATTRSNAFEVVQIYIWLHPIQMKLIPNSAKNRQGRNRLEQWRITLINGDTIVQTQQMNNVHNWLPFSFGMINDDAMGIAQRSVGEIIDPLQNFASFSLNAHIQATRKNIFGTTFYDPSAIEFGQMDEGEVAARIPLLPPGRGRDIRTMIFQNDNLLDTRQTTDNVGLSMDLLNQFFPTQQLPSQVAGIDRAINSQVSTVVQGANRRQQKAARLLDVTMLRVSRFIQYYNIIQFQQDVTTTGEDGKEFEVAVDELRDSNIQYMVGQGLKSIDRQEAAEIMKELAAMIFQNPQIIERVDVLGLITFIGDLQGVEMDLTKFDLQAQQAEAQAPAGGGGLGEGVPPGGVVPPEQAPPGGGVAPGDPNALVTQPPAGAAGGAAIAIPGVGV